MFTGEYLKETYPKSHEKLVDFILGRLQTASKIMGAPPEGTPQVPREFGERVVTGLLMGNWRTLYDFFDENEIIVLLQCIGKFSYSVGRDWVGEFNTRVEAEKEAFEAAFKMLEDGI